MGLLEPRRDDGATAGVKEGADGIHMAGLAALTHQASPFTMSQIGSASLVLSLPIVPWQTHVLPMS